ncbi:CotH kinase family protein [Limosilactobacillus panis]|uniref:CotH kinase family protein n=1 Tax=Limosilactobacillus panis TaxID=47493 RepID=UPI001C97A467|nr:CotH kinase family protein [Limosilactobacillus panis]QZN93896.1 CotH kinase family protein [Limosilactobacillus panis]
MGNKITKDNRKPVQISIKLTNGVIIDGWATIKWQGNSSLAWPKKGYRLKLFKDQAMTKKLKVELQNSGFKTNSFNLKACYTDPTAGLNIVNAELFKQITASRPNLANSIVNDMPNYGQVAGIPLELGINNLDQGLYVLETYQEDKLYNLDDKLSDNIALSDNQSDLSTFTQPFTTDDLVDTAFNNRSPKKVDQSVVDRFNELYQLANASDADYYKLEEQYLDVFAAIDYLTFISAINDVDGITKNITYISKAGSKWVLMPYDLDMTWNTLYNGAIMSIDTNIEDLLNSYQQRLANVDHFLGLI